MLRFTLACAAVAALSVPANAQKIGPATGQGGSVPLSTVLEIAKPYPNLQSQVRLRLIATGLTKDKVTCGAQRLPNTWTNLGGARLGPYTCAIARRTLTIVTEPTYFDKAGYKLKPDDPMLAAKATRITESRLKWSWK
jgi:hypothetical protein